MNSSRAGVCSPQHVSDAGWIRWMKCGSAGLNERGVRSGKRVESLHEGNGAKSAR